MPNKDELEKDMQALAEKHGLWGWVALWDSPTANGVTALAATAACEEGRAPQFSVALRSLRPPQLVPPLIGKQGHH